MRASRSFDLFLAQTISFRGSSNSRRYSSVREGVKYIFNEIIRSVFGRAGYVTPVVAGPAMLLPLSSFPQRVLPFAPPRSHPGCPVYIQVSSACGKAASCHRRRSGLPYDYGTLPLASEARTSFIWRRFYWMQYPGGHRYKGTSP